MIDINVSGGTPLEALASLAALGLLVSASKEVSALAADLTQFNPPPAPVEQQPAPSNVVPFTPPAAPIPAAPVPAGMPAPAPLPTAVPTAAPTYTLDQIMQAAGIFADTSPQAREAAVALIRKYGVMSLAELPKEHYGAFVVELRALGAAI